MGLTKAQQSLWERSRAAGSGGQAVRLDNGACAFLLATIVRDLSLEESFPEMATPSEFFGQRPPSELSIDGVEPLPVFERLLEANPDADTYYACLASLHKSRLKYDRILRTQPMPTLEQVGPRGLLQYGHLSPAALAGLLFWRKWLYDIDNRAAQETGYLFEPIIASAVGGTPCPARRSPVKRHADGRKGRQVDCLLGDRVYEFKIRLTIAASGQGRWREELDYPVDCSASGYTPVLVVLDATPNPKLAELERAFLAQQGEVYKGADAWAHLDELAGATMATFLENYVRGPIDDLIEAAEDLLPDFSARIEAGRIVLGVGGESLVIARGAEESSDDDGDLLPEDVVDDFAGA